LEEVHTYAQVTFGFNYSAVSGPRSRRLDLELRNVSCPESSKWYLVTKRILGVVILGRRRRSERWDGELN